MPGLTVPALLAVVLLVVAVSVAVVAARGRGGGAEGEGDGGHGTLRRVFVYALALLGAVLTASGLSGLLRVALSAAGETVLVGEGDRGVALGLALVIVGAPVWLLAWGPARRSARARAGERRALGRRLYLAAIRVVALSVAVPHAIEAGRWLVGAAAYDPAAVARLVVWGALWAYHERVADEVPFGSRDTRLVDRLEVYVVAAAALSLVGASLAAVVTRSLRTLYEAVTGTGLLTGIPALGDLRSVAVVVLVGAALWWWHWRTVARGDAGSRGWLVYLFLAGVLPGTLAAVTSAAVLLHAALAWVLGAATEPAVVHFGTVPPALAGVMVGGALWGYHRGALRETAVAGAGWTGPERLYRYLLTAVGLVAAAAGVTTIVALGLELAVPGRALVAPPEQVRDQVAVGLTLLVVGVPLWLRFWSVIQRRARQDPGERLRLVRRVLIFGAFGIAIVIGVVALSVVLFEFFDAALSGELSARLVEEQRWSLALLVTAGAASVHYGLVLREDRAAAPPDAAAPPRLRELVLLASGAEELAGRVAERVDARITAWERRDVPEDQARPRGEDGDVAERLAEALSGVGTRRAVVLVEDDGTLRVIPVGDG